MTGNIFTNFKIIDQSNLINIGFDHYEKEAYEYKLDLIKKHIEYNEQDMSIEVIDGNCDYEGREINKDLVIAINMTKEKIKTYSGNARWYCFDNIETMNCFLDELYFSMNCAVAQIEYDMNDLANCLASSEDTIRIIKKADSINCLHKDIVNLFVFNLFNDNNNSWNKLTQVIDQIESMINEDCICMISSVKPYHKENHMRFFYTGEKINLQTLIGSEENMEMIYDSTSFEIPDFLKK